MEKLEVLKKSDVFHYLDEADLKELAKLCTEEEFEAGTVICRQDKPAEEELIRLSVGLENIDDLIDDLEQALKTR